MGFQAGWQTSTGGGNNFIGYNAGQTNTTGNNNTVIGYQADVASANLTNATAIGANAVVSASNTMQLGNGSVTNVNTSGSISAAGASLTGALNMNAHPINNVTDPTNAQDAATKHYVDITSTNAVNTAVNGATNTIAKFTASNAVGNSALTDDGTTLSYGTNFSVNESTGNLATNGSVAIGGSTTLHGDVDMTGHTLTNVSHINNGGGGTIAIDGNTDFNNHNLSNLGYVSLNSTSTISAVSGTVNFGSNIDVRNNSIFNVPDPTNAQDAATKHYVDATTSTAVNGTTNTMAKFTGANAVGNSSLSDNGTTLGYQGANITQTTLGSPLTIHTQDGGPSVGPTGSLTIRTGPSGHLPSGSMYIYTGDILGGGPPGSVNIYAGTSSGFGGPGTGGAVNISSGNSNMGNGGDLTLTGGQVNNFGGSGNGGNIYLNGG